MRASHPRAGGSAARRSRILEDLATLLRDEVALYMCLEGKGAVFSVKSAEMFAFGKATIQNWARITPLGRAERVVQWIQEAAKYCRNPRIRWAPPA